MPEVLEILNKDFLLNLVAIEELFLFSSAIDTKFQDKVKSFVEVKVLVLKSEKEKIQENRYLLRLKEVINYKIQSMDDDICYFEFDTDEVVLTIEQDFRAYCLKFFNSSTNIEICFRSLDCELLA